MSRVKVLIIILFFSVTGCAGRNFPASSKDKQDENVGTSSGAGVEFNKVDYPQIVREANARIERINRAVNQLKTLSNQVVPEGLSYKDKKTWNEYTWWLKRKQKQLIMYARRLEDKIFRARKYNPEDLLFMCQSLDMDFLRVRNQIQVESRRYNTVSNVLKVRHDAAMNSVENMR